MKSAGIIQVVQVLTFSSAIAISSLAQGTLTLIGPSLRNGSFEQGTPSPWTEYAGNLMVIEDADFASHGESFAAVSQTSTTPILRTHFSQTLAASPSDGLTFMLTFDARNGSPGFEVAQAFFAALNRDGTIAFSGQPVFMLPGSMDEGWQSYRTEFPIPATWDGGGDISVGLGFAGAATVGTTYTGYFDNIVLQQIPEPSAVVLSFLSASLLGWRWHQARRR